MYLRKIPVPRWGQDPIKALARRIFGPTAGCVKAGPYVGYVDGATADGLLRGWIVDMRPDAAPVSLGFYADGQLLSVEGASLRRVDVQQTTGCGPFCGFEFLATAAVFPLLGKGPVVLEIRPQGQDRVFHRQTLHVPNPVAIAAQDPSPKPPLTAHAPLFDPDLTMPGVVPNPLGGYLDHLRLRTHLADRFPITPDGTGMDAYLLWYVTQYRRTSPLRVPLGADQIAYLNTQTDPRGLTRLMEWRLADRPDLAVRLDTEQAVLDVLFWWAFQDCAALGFEDCLVPQDVVTALNTPTAGLTLTPFLHRFHNAHPAAQACDLDTHEGQQALIQTLMDHATVRPDLWRFVPGHSTRAPVTRSPQGHRFEAACLPCPTGSEKVDVQLIGPLHRASGLGQATRLSRQILQHTDLSMRAVNFDLDHPSPLDGAVDRPVQDYGPARVNLIHLNAEAIPTAFAFQPDVFSNSYNIGYVFWELDRPALCHSLGMALLDEIWVASDFGVQIYTQDPNAPPVTNVGMCFADTPRPDPVKARNFAITTCAAQPGDFICLCSFDSFSFVQRKNPLGAIAAFQAAFPDVPQARLILKTHNRGRVFDAPQKQMWDQIDATLARDPRITVLDATLPYEDVLRLTAGADCYISLHRAEGWGFGLLEAMRLRTPVLCTAYSGNMDFCTDETAWLVGYDMTPLCPGDYIFDRPGSAWATPDTAHAAAQLRALFDDAPARHAKVQSAFDLTTTQFSAHNISGRYQARLHQILEGARL